VDVQVMPTPVLFADGQPAGRLVGPHPAYLQTGIERLLAHSSILEPTDVRPHQQ
jgi:thioredoxin-like negative regulator of GroEL